MNFNDFANQMQLKYRVTLAVAILKSKPENLPLDQHINNLKAKINEEDMDYDSDVTICSDDFLMDDDEAVEETKIDGNEEGDNLSLNILEGFDLKELAEEGNRDNNLDTQILEVFDERMPDKEVEEVTQNIPTQTTFCESTQSQDLLKGFELVQNSQTFCETEMEKDEKIFTKPNILTKKVNRNKNDSINYISIPTGLSQPLTYDSQKTQIYSLNGLFDEFTHVSESQNYCCHIKNNHLYNNSKKSSDLSDAKEKKSADDANKYDDPVNQDKINQNNKYVNVDKNNTEIVLSETKRFRDDGDKNKADINLSLQEIINPNLYLFTSQDNAFGHVNATKSNSNGTFHEDTNEVQTFQNSKENTNNFKENTLDENVCNEEECNIQDELDIEDEELVQEDSQAELIPFKVIEELNRVRSYLNRRDRVLVEGYATDSGYKSDSQSRGSNKSFQSSDAWINQSAHCLLKFLMDCPIVLRTRDITVEISWTLGRLIDKLHDEEKYPSFLEEVLNTVEKLLRDIYEGDSYVEDVILRKDVDIHKLFSLNRSHHIIKYTLDKITHILETFLSRITDDGILEITDTIQMENLCYIFHILEYILKRHSMTKDNTSQYSTQNTQDEKTLKRSSLTDVWRKKWNPNYKSDSQPLNPQKKSVETKCSEILNKIIVKAMDGYSLISFAALQCYNLLQS